MPLRTRRGVELARVGEWDASTGKWNCTRAQIASAVRAGKDPRFRTPIIKPGHIDPRHDGEPAIGRVTNLRASEDGDVLLGDITVPETVDDDMEIRFPSRSIESLLGVEMANGDRFDMVMTGLALLGVTPPAIQQLADLPPSEDHAPEMVAAMAVAASAVPAEASWGEVAAAGQKKDGQKPKGQQKGGREFDESKHPRGEKGTSNGGRFVSRGSGYSSTGKSDEAAQVKSLQRQLVRLGFLDPKAGRGGEAVDGLLGPKTEAALKAWQRSQGKEATGKASVADIAAIKGQKDRKARAKGRVELVKEKAKKVAASLGDDVQVREIWADSVIFDDGRGHLWRSEVSDEPGKFTVGDPLGVVASYEVLASTPAGEVALALKQPLHYERGREAESVRASQGAPSVDVTPKMREALGLDDKADEQAVEAALDALKSKAEAQPPAPEQPAPTETATGQPGALDQAKVDQLVAASVGKHVEAAVAAAVKPWEDKVTDLSGQLADRNKREAETVKEQVLASAVQTGKIRPADREQWSKDYDEAPAVTTRILASLQPGTAVPVLASGHTGQLETVTDLDAEYRKFFPAPAQAGGE